MGTAHLCKDSSQVAARDQIESYTCVLCGDHQVSKQLHDQHVARHLQELALFVLPQNREDSEDGEHASSSESESVAVFTDYQSPEYTEERLESGGLLRRSVHPSYKHLLSGQFATSATPSIPPSSKPMPE